MLTGRIGSETAPDDCWVGVRLAPCQSQGVSGNFRNRSFATLLADEGAAQSV
jgi:hypothetical protein